LGTARAAAARRKRIAARLENRKKTKYPCLTAIEIEDFILEEEVDSF